jgi:hypothetical protein
LDSAPLVEIFDADVSDYTHVGREVTIRSKCRNVSLTLPHKDLAFVEQSNRHLTVSLTDLPNKLILAIVEGLPDETLFPLTRVSLRFRQLGGTTMLHRLGIIDSRRDRFAVHLHGWIFPHAIQLLFSIDLPLKITFDCDLFFVLQFEEDLHQFCSEKVMVTDLTICIPDTETHLLREP